MKDSYSERLAKYIFILITLTIVGTICWYFRNIIAYIILAAILTLLSNPLYKWLGKVKIRGKHLPSWLGAILSLLAVFIIAGAVITTLIPLLRDVSHDVSKANINNIAQAAAIPLANFNSWIIHTFPKAGADFRIEAVVLEQLQGLLDFGTFSSMVGSVTSFIANLGIALFATIFIGFFFIKSPGLVTSIITAFVPDRYEHRVRASINKIGVLVSRYFVGLVIEVLGVALINFLGLSLVARMGLKYSLGIAFMTGMLNIIPYIGPLIGYVLGVSLSLVIKYACVTSYGIGVGLLPFILIVLGILLFTQLIDNYVFQPLIFSNSVNVHPLEIFIVFLMAGRIGGIAGMLAAIPAYTVLREIAKQFLGNVKAVRMLTGPTDKEE